VTTLYNVIGVNESVTP